MREPYATRDMFDGVKTGKPMPYGMVIVMKVYAARLDDDSKSEVGEDGKCLKSRKLHTWEMEKRLGWRSAGMAKCFQVRHLSALEEFGVPRTARETLGRRGDRPSTEYLPNEGRAI